MIDYFLAFEEGCNRFPGFSYEVQGVYQEREGEAIRFYTYVVQERGGAAGAPEAPIGSRPNSQRPG